MLGISLSSSLGRATALGFDYYIDSVSGSDSNTGRSAGQAWATLGKLVTAGVLANGVKIGLARGSTWREQIDATSYTDMLVEGYGSLALPQPRVIAADIASSGGWTKTAGRTNVYERSWTDEAYSGSFRSVWEDQTALVWVSSVATCDSTPGSFYTSNTIANPGTIYIHPTGSGDPASNGKVYEITKRNYAVGLGARGTIRRVWGEKNGHNDGSLVADTIEYCIARDGLKHNALSRTIKKSWLYRAAECVGRTTATMWVGYSGDGRGIDILAEDSYAYGSGSSVTSGFYSHTSGDAQKHDSVTYRRLFAYNCSTGAYASNAASMTVEDLFAERVDVGINSVPNGATSIDNATVIVTSADGANGSTSNRRGLILGGAGSTCYVRDFKFYLKDTTTSGGAVYSTADEFTIEYSTIVGAGTGYKTSLGITATISDYNVTNVVFASMDKMHDLPTGMVPTVSDYNVAYLGSAAIDNDISNFTYTTWATYRAAYPALDANSSTSDPLLAGNPQLGDFSLQVGTPADTGGRAAGSRKVLTRPDWAALVAAVDQGYCAPWEMPP